MHKVINFKVFGICLILQYLQTVNAVGNTQNKCEKWEFQCRNGECINANSKCDTKLDCSDRSDETFEQCYSSQCPNHRCSYGACFEDSKFCDGVKDCWDGTDEYEFHCANDSDIDELYKNKIRGECIHESYTQYQCQQTKECIPYSQACDGVEHCRDKSDESYELCVGSICPEGSFRCAYGACIAKTAACNHVIDCRDESDELTAICQSSHNISAETDWEISRWKITPIDPQAPDFAKPVTPTTTTVAPRPNPQQEEKSCTVSTDDKALRLETMYNGMPYSKGNNVSHSTNVRLSCSPSHILRGNDINTCDNGKWKAPWPECVKVCDHIKIANDPSYNAVCSYEGRIINCTKEPLVVHTIAEIRCAQGYKPSLGVTKGERKCNSNGNWEAMSRKLKCEPDCGKTFNTVEGDPWLVSIYHHTSNSNYSFGCMGTIINPFYVLTIASCFSPNPVSHTHRVVLGNHTVTYNENQEHGLDISTIESIEVNKFLRFALLKMVNPFVLSAKVRPICLGNGNPITTPVQFRSLGEQPVESWRSLGEPLVHLDPRLNAYTLTHVVDNVNSVNKWISFDSQARIQAEIKQNDII